MLMCNNFPLQVRNDLPHFSHSYGPLYDVSSIVVVDFALEVVIIGRPCLLFDVPSVVVVVFVLEVVVIGRPCIFFI